MAKTTILDGLAEAMKTLSKREGKALTPRQRVAAAQRWNSLARIADERLADLDATSEAVPVSSEEYDRIMDVYNKEGQAYDNMKLLVDQGNAYDNPFLSDNIDKYQEQSEFLDWCRYNRVEPNGQALKQFRWETYKTLPYRERQWIANKDAVRNYMRDNYTLYGQQPPELKTLRDVDEYWTKNVWNGVEPREGYLEYAYPKRQPYSSPEEFPDYLDYNWRY